MATYRIQDLPAATLPLDGAAVVAEVLQGGLNRQTPIDTMWRPLGTASDEACAGDDARLSDSRPPVGAAGGDLAGFYPNPDVAAVAGTLPTLTGLALLGAIDAAAGRAALGIDYGPATSGRVAIRDAVNGLTNDEDLTVEDNGGTLALRVEGYLRLDPVTPPGSPVEGEIWNDIPHHCVASHIAGMTQYETRLIASQASDTSVTSSGADTPMIASASLGTFALPVSFLTPGKVIDIEAEGRIVCSGTTATLKIHVGATVAATVAAMAIPVTAGDAFRLRVRIAVQAAGIGGLVRAVGTLSLGNGPAIAAIEWAINATGAAAVVNTNIVNALAVTWNWATGGQSLVTHVSSVKVSA